MCEKTEDLNNFNGKSLTIFPSDCHWARVRDNEIVDTLCEYSMSGFCSCLVCVHVHVMKGRFCYCVVQAANDFISNVYSF